MDKTKRSLKATNVVLEQSTLKKEVTTPRKGRKKSEDKLDQQFNYPIEEKKPFGITYRQLRNLCESNDLVKIVANRLKHSVLKVPWHIVPKQKSQDTAEMKATQQKLQPEIDYITSLLERPNSNGDTFRTLFTPTLKDTLVIDNGIIEKVRDSAGNIVELYHVDGATVKPCIDKAGLYKDPAYKQYLDYQDSLLGTPIGKKEPVAEFTVNDLLIFQVNPKGEAGMVGYGESPVEMIVRTVLMSVQAMLYNSEFFNSDKLPPYLVNLEGVKTPDLLAFKEAFISQLQGKPWAGAFTNAKDLKVQGLRPTNLEMQFQDYNLWLAKIIFGAFEVSPQDLGFTLDVNKATAQVQRDITKSQGVANLMDVIAEEINMDLIPDLANGNQKFKELEFVWEQQDQTDLKVQAEVDEIYLKWGKVTVDELRLRDGQKPFGEEKSLDEEEDEESETVETEDDEEEEKVMTKSKKGKRTEWHNPYNTKH